MKSTIKVLYFCAGVKPTTRELAEIARLEKFFAQVLVRRGDSAADASYGSGAEELAAEITAGTTMLAGTKIPSAYSGTTGAITLTIPSVANPDQFAVFPAAVTIDASNADVQQLAAVKAIINPATGLAEMADLAANAMVTYASSDETKATVSATGLVTAVAAGAANITATYQPGTSVTAGAVEADDEIYTKAAHGFQTGDQVRLVSLTGGTGLTAGNDYFFKKLSASTGYLCATLADALAGVPVAVSVDATDVVLALTKGLQVTAIAIEADDDICTKAAHGFDTGDAVKLVSLTGGTGLTAGTTYYVIKLTASTFKLATSLANAIAGTAINVTADSADAVLQAAPVTSVCAVTVAA